MAALAAAGLMMASCANGSDNHDHEGHDMAEDSAMHAAPAPKVPKTVSVMYPDVDSKAASSIRDIVDGYLKVKNALVSDDATAAANGAVLISDAAGKLDKSLLSAEQKKSYDAVESSVKEHAAGIANNAADIQRQRSHFSNLSESVYTLVKTFGAGRAVYHDHCPMARDNQGAMWISEARDVRNPYFGAGMLTCGTVEEVIQ